MKQIFLYKYAGNSRYVYVWMGMYTIMRKTNEMWILRKIYDKLELISMAFCFTYKVAQIIFSGVEEPNQKPRFSNAFVIFLGGRETVGITFILMSKYQLRKATAQDRLQV